MLMMNAISPGAASVFAALSARLSPDVDAKCKEILGFAGYEQFKNRQEKSIDAMNFKRILVFQLDVEEHSLMRIKPLIDGLTELKKEFEVV